MFDCKEVLLRQIRLGADSRIGFQEVRFAGQRVAGPSRDALADELAAFANAEGGVCVLGVRDEDRQVQGVPMESLDTFERFVNEICVDSIEPQLFVRIERMQLPQSSGSPAVVLKVSVAPSLFVHRSPGDHTALRARMSPKGDDV